MVKKKTHKNSICKCKNSKKTRKTLRGLAWIDVLKSPEFSKIEMVRSCTSSKTLER